MRRQRFDLAGVPVDYYFGGELSALRELCDPSTTVILTDQHVMDAHRVRFRNWNTITIPPGEANKTQSTVDRIIAQLLEMGADRGFTLVGVGGGVITDITGYVASVYMRGIRFGFFPSTLLSMVDASIGGKNGIDVGAYKNMVGTFRQPAFIAFDPALLRSLPLSEWQNGFAEVIKHAVIKDATMFRSLEERSPSFFRKNKEEAAKLVRRNALLKTKVVQADPFEKGERKLLNFGHTLGHAIETPYKLSHGEAIAIGMSFAARLSESELGFQHPSRVVNLLKKYGLPTALDFDRDKVIGLLRMDKKKTGDAIHFILLERIGRAVINELSIETLYQNLP